MPQPIIAVMMLVVRMAAANQAWAHGSVSYGLLVRIP